MTTKNIIVMLGTLFVLLGLAFADHIEEIAYKDLYTNRIKALMHEEKILIDLAGTSNLRSSGEREKMRKAIATARLEMKKADCWLRYLRPLSQKLINGPLPVEWETEVFEKFEKPYRRVGSGLALALEYLEEDTTSAEGLSVYFTDAFGATKEFLSDSVLNLLDKPDHFFFANRLFLLNLATIYTTGFDCPDSSMVLAELEEMLSSQLTVYEVFNRSYPDYFFPVAYMAQFRQMIGFVGKLNGAYLGFDHFTFIRNYVNPLFAHNQKLIREYRLRGRNLQDYSLNDDCKTIFSKGLYDAQNVNGIFHRIKDPVILSEIESTGRLLFYDPLLSGNNSRSCASCHKPEQHFTDTVESRSLHLNGKERLSRNTPTLLNARYNHLLMADGRHYSLQDQALAVITNTAEMGCRERDLLRKIASCDQYKKAFSKLVAFTPQQPEISLSHISSALTLYYSRFSGYDSPFDRAMNEYEQLSGSAIRGYNLFMGKAKCGTCHFAPQFNGVKPPYTGSEFEVLGVPADTNYSALSADNGRYGINPAPETSGAFRTGTLRNIARTSPYMHNGVFRTLRQVIDFYNNGGGAGKGLPAHNQTLPGDSLKLTRVEKEDLISFMQSLTEEIKFESPPKKLPLSRHKKLNDRVISGKY